MTKITFNTPAKSGLLALAILLTSLTAMCAPATTNSQAKGTNAPALAPILIPKSEFAIPASLAAGRDPFYPNRTILNTAPAGTNVVAASVAFTLQGVSGTKLKRFALINNRTFESGEDAEVTVNRIKVRIKCVSIEEDSATIEYDGRQQQLRLKPGL